MKGPNVITRGSFLTCLISLCALIAPAAQASNAVLGSDAAETANALREAIGSHTDFKLGPVRIVPGSVIIPVQESSQSFQLLAPGSDGHQTIHGTLRLPSAYPATELSRLVESLNRVVPPLEWKLVEQNAEVEAYGIAGVRATRLRDARMRSLRLRDGKSSAPVLLEPEQDLRFSFSDWLAKEDGVRNIPVEDSGWGELREALRLFPKSEAGVFGAREQIRGAPKLWAYAAMAAERRGQFVKALAYADVATRFARPDTDALRIWERLTQQEVAIPTDAFPSMSAPIESTDNHHLATVFVILGLLAWVWLIRRESRRRILVGFGASVIAAAAFFLASADSSTPSTVSVPELPQNLQAPLAGGACVADPMMWSPHGYTLFATCDGDEVSFEISPLKETDVRVQALGSTIGPATEAARRHLERVFRQAQAKGWRLTPRPPDGGLGARRAVTLSAGDRFERGLTAMLACLALFMLLVVGKGCVQIIQSSLRRDPVIRRGLWVLAIAVVALHVLVDSRMVMVYTGYDLTTRLAGLDSMPRYGAGTMWIAQPAFGLLGTSHETIQWLNRVLGALLIVPTMGLVFAMVPRARWGALLAAACVGLLPVFLRDHTSEGIQTGTIFFLAMGLAGLMLAMRRGGDLWMAWASLPLLLFVGTCRPEAMAALPCVAVGALVSRRPSHGLSPRVLLVLGGIALAWMLPHVQWLLSVTESLVLAEDISPIDGFTAERVARVWMQDNIFTRLHWVPWTIPLLALIALQGKGQRALVIGWLTAALAWLAVTSVDLPDVSIPRVHLPALLLVLPAAALGLERFRRHGRWQGVVGIVTILWAASAAPTVLESTNGDAEETLIQRLHEEVADAGKGSCIARLGLDDDPPAGRTPRYFPEYLFPNQTLMPLKDIGGQRASCEKGTWVVLGTRCYMRDPALASSKNESAYLAACERVRREVDLEPILELKAPHRPQSTLPMFPDVDSLELGLYRKVERSSEPTP